MPPWSDAALTMKTFQCTVAILPHNGALHLATESEDEMAEAPNGLAGLHTQKNACLSGPCGSLQYRAGYLSTCLPEETGSAWMVCDNGEVWIACSPPAIPT
jgi:hypothetical protein